MEFFNDCWSTNVYNAGSEYVAPSNVRYKGYNDGSASFRPSGTTYGSMNDYADSDFLGGQTIDTFNVLGDSTVSQPSNYNVVCD